MTQPSSYHLNAALTNFTLATLQASDAFVALFMAPTLKVDKQSDYYWIYDSANWNKPVMGPRAPGAESRGGGYTLSSTQYGCKKHSVHIDLIPDDVANADAALNPEADAAEYLANQCRMYLDQMLVDTGFKTGVWDTEYQGVSSNPNNGEFVQWDSSSSDPRADILLAQEALQTEIGKQANTLILGHRTYMRLLNNAQVKETIKYTAEATVEKIKQSLAAYFGVAKIVVAGGFQNTAAKGQTASNAQILTTTDAWLGYVEPQASLRGLSAMKSFAWYGPYGNAIEGMAVNSFEIPEKDHTMRHELDVWIDMKVTASAAGVYFDDAVA